MTPETIAANAQFAMELEAEVSAILEAETSNRPWGQVDKSKLPASCFLWVEDPAKKATWHLPYREGTGAIDSKTGMYTQAGPVNLGALRAIAAAVAGSRTGKPMNVPAAIKSKINKLLQKYKIGKFADQAPEESSGRELVESMAGGGLSDVRLDKGTHKVYGVAVLKPTSSNATFRDAKGRKYLPKALESVARLVNGAKVFVDHPTEEEMKERRGVRSMRDLLGFLENGHIDEKGTVRGDLEYLSSQAQWFEPIVEQMADKVGNSIHAYGESFLDKSDMLEAVQDVRMLTSVDLVTEPGSTTSLYEARAGAPDKETEDEEIAEEEKRVMEIKSLTLDEVLEQRPDIAEEIAKRERARLEGARTVEQLQGEVKKMTEALNTANKKLDEYAVKEQARERETKLLALIDESKIEKRYITSVFMQNLRGAKDEEEAKKMLEDRKQIIAAGAGGVHGMGDDKSLLSESKGEKKPDASAKEYEEAVRS